VEEDNAGDEGQVRQQTEKMHEKVYGVVKMQIIKGNRGIKLIKCKRILSRRHLGDYKSAGYPHPPGSKPDPIILYFRFQFVGKGKQKVLKVFLMRKIHSDWPSADKLFPAFSTHFPTLFPRIPCLFLSGCDTSVCII